MAFDTFSIITACAGTLAVGSAVYRVFVGEVRERAEVEEDVNRAVNQIIEYRKEEQDDVFTLMLRNVAELREYYTINKQQARRAFNAALIACMLGFIVFCLGLYFNQQSTTVITLSAIVAAIIQVISGLFFWLYRKALEQINLFHFSLLKTEKFLTSIKLVEKISEDKRDENYSYIIKAIINSDIFEKESVIKISSNKNKSNKTD